MRYGVFENQYGFPYRYPVSTGLPYSRPRLSPVTGYKASPIPDKPSSPAPKATIKSPWIRWFQEVSKVSGAVGSASELVGGLLLFASAGLEQKRPPKALLAMLKKFPARLNTARLSAAAWGLISTAWLLECLGAQGMAILSRQPSMFFGNSLCLGVVPVLFAESMTKLAGKKVFPPWLTLPLRGLYYWGCGLFNFGSANLIEKELFPKRKPPEMMPDKLLGSTEGLTEGLRFIARDHQQAAQDFSDLMSGKMIRQPEKTTADNPLTRFIPSMERFAGVLYGVGCIPFVLGKFSSARVLAAASKCFGLGGILGNAEYFLVGQERNDTLGKVLMLATPLKVFGASFNSKTWGAALQSLGNSPAAYYYAYQSGLEQPNILNKPALRSAERWNA